MATQSFTASLFEHSWITIWVTGRSADMSHWNDHYNPDRAIYVFLLGTLRDRTYRYVWKPETQKDEVDCVRQKATTFLVGVFEKPMMWFIPLSSHARSAPNKSVHNLDLCCKLRFWCDIINKRVCDRFYSLTSIILLNPNIAFCIVFGYIWISATDIYVYGYRLTRSENVKIGKCHCQINKNVYEIYKINIAVTYQKCIYVIRRPCISYKRVLSLVLAYKMQYQYNKMQK